MSGRERVVFFALIAVAIVCFLIIAYKLNQRISVLIPDQGGSLHEGVIGQPHFINPVLAIADPDRDMTSLVYAGLMRPDGNGGLVPELAERYEISEDGLSYVFYVRKGAEFQDGKNVTVDDVIFTIETAKNPIVKSPMRAGWEGVEIEKIDDKTLKFWLKRPYAPFLENTTIGILPKHIWKNIPIEQLNLSELNLSPVGAGPYKISKSFKNGSGLTSLTLNSFSNYVLGEPYIGKIVFNFYPSEVELLNAYQNGDIDSISAVSPQNLAKITRRDGDIKSMNLPRIFGTFFNQNEKPIFLEKPVRQALEMSIDKKQIVRDVLGGYAKEISSPIPEGSFGAIALTESEFNLDKAKTLLEKNGWKFSQEKMIYMKEEKKQATKELSFSISTSNAPDLIRTANILKSSWEKLGAKVDVKVFEISDLNQNVIRSRKYDALLFGEVVGRDPDPFAFWHSSQRNDPGLNIALYTSSKVDKILKEARRLVSREDRAKKYEDFQKEVQADSPSIFLYSPSFIYILPKKIKGVDTEDIVTPSERFANIYKWYIDTKYVWKILHKNN